METRALRRAGVWICGLPMTRLRCQEMRGTPLHRLSTDERYVLQGFGRFAEGLLGGEQQTGSGVATLTQGRAHVDTRRDPGGGHQLGVDTEGDPSKSQVWDLPGRVLGPGDAVHRLGGVHHPSYRTSAVVLERERGGR